MRTVPLRIGVLGSGKGSNFAAIVRAIQSGQLNASISLVLSDNPNAGILEIGRSLGMPTEALPISNFRTKLEPEIETLAAQKLVAAKTDLVVLAGYMRMIKAPLLDLFPNRIVNIHPSLLPAFPGLEAWKQAWEARVPETGCTVHWVDSGMDTGKVIAQAKVPVLETDTPETLHARIQEAEHKLYPTCIENIAASGNAFLSA
jgi:phosphoribosylglycinamide formyltransferase-1